MKKSLVFIIIISILLLSACGGNQAGNSSSKNPSGNQKGQKKLTEVNVMLDWYPNAVHSFLYVAKEKGYFKQEGLKVNLKFPTNPTDPINLAAAGKVTLGISYQPDVIIARSKGVPVKSVAAIVRSPLNRIVYLKNSGIHSPKDLQGKTVGYPGIPLNQSLIDTMVKKDGGDPSKVKMVDVGFNLISSLVSKKVDAVIGAYINHEVPVLQHKGYQVGYLNPTDYGVPNYYELVAVTSDQTWKKHQATIKAFWRAATKGYTYMKNNPKDALNILLNHQDKDNFPLNKEVETKSMHILLPKMSSDQGFGSQSKTSWQHTIDWMATNHLIKKKPSVNDIFENIVK